jgi:UPF0716 protein FxsA
MPFLLLVAAFIVVPIVELALIIEVGQAIGVLPTIAILLLDSILGSLLLRSQGRTAWRRFNDAARGGRVPHREALDGALVIFGGALLLTPGFATDVLGLLLLAPPTRAVARRLLARAIGRRLVMGVVGGGRREPSRPGARRDPGRPGAGRAYDVESTATEADGRGAGAGRARLER